MNASSGGNSCSSPTGQAPAGLVAARVDQGRELELWRPALLAFYWHESPWMRQKLECLERGDPFTADDLRVIEGLCAAIRVAA